jgi:mono/diheme cytochrome c family protein
MSRLIVAAALLLFVSIGAASRSVAAQGAQDQASTLPDGPGRALVAAQCASCHTLDEALSKRTTADRWLLTVQQMIDRGAPITAPDAAAISTYLGEYFGLDAPASGQAPPQASALPDGPGRDVLTQKCFQCHQMSMWSAIRQDQTAWESVIYRMIGRGALWTNDEINAMAGYLARVRGPMPAGQR